MVISNLNIAGSYCKAFFLERKVVAIIVLVLLLILGLVLIIGGVVGFVPLLPSVISGVILTLVPLFILAIRFLRSKPSLLEGTRFFELHHHYMPLTETVEIYRKDRELPRSMPHKVIKVRDSDDAHRWPGNYKQDTYRGSIYYGRWVDDVFCAVHMVHSDEEIVAVYGKLPPRFRNRE